MTYSMQTTENPLFPDLLWSRPENRAQAGKLLIIGGNLHEIANISQAASLAYKAGAGTVKTLVPDALRKMIGNAENVYFAASNPSGSFAKESLAEWLELANWADMVLLAGDFGRNSETAIVLESFLEKHSGPLTVCRDTINLLPKSNVFNRENTLIIATQPQLQKLVAPEGVLINNDWPIQKLADCLSELSVGRKFITWQHKHLFVAAHTKVSITPYNEETWRLRTSCYASVWLMQFPEQPFEALTTSVFENIKNL